MTGLGASRASRVTIIGGGVMGLMTAYYAAPLAETVTVLEKTWVGDPATASFGLTRSVRNDYRDRRYARLAFSARRLWLELQQQAGEQLLVDCGCLNLASASITPDLDRSYAAQSFAVLEQLRLPREVFSAAALRERFGQFRADRGWLDVAAGFADVAAVTRFLRRSLAARGVRVAEQSVLRGIARSGDGWRVATAAGPVDSDALVITAGLGTSDVLGLVPGCAVRFPVRPGRPAQSKYFIPPAGMRDRFTQAQLPVFAYLDIGIYGHPLYDGRTPGVKIGWYDPPDVTTVRSRIRGVEDFVTECVPALRGAEVVDVTAASGVDSCSYDLVADDEFILGQVPGADGVYAGTGWRGTGYKFAPWAGQVLARLATRRQAGSDISRFAPGRFAAGAVAGQVAS